MRKNEEPIKPGDVVRITRPGDALCGMRAETIEVGENGDILVRGGVIGVKCEVGVFELRLTKGEYEKEPSLTERLKKILSRHE